MFTSTLRAAIVLPFLAVAPAAHATDIEDALALLMLVGFDINMAQLETSMREAPSEGDPAFIFAWERAVVGLYDKDTMFDAVAAEITASISTTDLELLSVFFEADLGAKMTAAEVFSQMPEIDHIAETEGPLLVTSLQGDDPEGRLGVYDRMSEAFGGPHSAMQITLGLQYQILRAQATASGSNLSDADLLGFMAAGQGELMSNIQEGALESKAFTYRDIEVEELELYTDFLESRAGQKLYDAVDAGLQDVLLNDIDTFGERLRSYLVTQKI